MVNHSNGARSRPISNGAAVPGPPRVRPRSFPRREKSMECVVGCFRSAGGCTPQVTRRVSDCSGNERDSHWRSRFVRWCTYLCARLARAGGVCAQTVRAGAWSKIHTPPGAYGIMVRIAYTTPPRSNLSSWSSNTLGATCGGEQSLPVKLLGVDVQEG